MTDTPAAAQHLRALRITCSALVAVAIGLVVFWPLPAHPADGGPLHHVMAVLWEHGLPRAITFDSVEFGLNVALFVPFGLVAYWWKPSVVRDTMLGFAATCLIEAIQGAALGGRVADPRDIAANTLGALLGSSVAAVWVRLRRKHRSGRGTG